VTHESWTDWCRRSWQSCGCGCHVIEGIGASQFGIGIVIARLIEAVLRDEKLVIPVAAYSHEHDVTFSLPSVWLAQRVSNGYLRRNWTTTNSKRLDVASER
jgi:malate/lactate dehydrogenase